MDYIDGEIVEGGELTGRKSFDIGAYPLFPGDDYGLYSGTFSVLDGARVADVTRERIVEVVAWQYDEGDCAEEKIAAVVRLDDGSWAAVMAGCDTTGWDCQAGVEWRWAPSRDVIITQGIDRETRRALRMALAIDVKTSGTVV